MAEKLKSFLPIVLLSLIPTLLLWFPFFLRLEYFWTIPLPQEGMATIVSNYDGPLYLVVAKTLYNQAAIKNNFSFDLPVEYYAAHFPLYPLLIRLFSFAFGYPYSSLLVTSLSSIFALSAFYLLSQKYLKQSNALFLTAVFAIFPARWLIVRSVGSPEPLFIGAVIASVYYFSNKKFWLAGFWGAIAQLTKPPGILLFLALFAASILPNFESLSKQTSREWFKSIKLKAYPIFLIPMSLLGLFIFYRYSFNDFFAYFHSGDNIHLFFPPFQIFNYSAPWVDTHWLEEIIFVYLIAALGLIQLINQKRNLLAWFVGIFFTSVLFVSHRDLIRYSLPITPFLLIAYSDVILKKEFKYVLALIILPIFLFSLAFISNNIMPISDWSPFL